MLDFLRRKKRSFIILLIFFAIIVVFVFWGVGPTPQQGSENQVVARVDGIPIYGSTYEDAYQRELEYYKRALGENFSPEVLERLNLRERTINALIDRILVLNEAERQGIDVSEEEIRKRIFSTPIFQKEGRFSKELYFAILQANRIKPAEYEQSVRQELLIEKIGDEVTKDVTVTDEEVWERFLVENRKVSLNYIVFKKDRFKKEVKVDDDALKKFFEEHKSNYMIPPRVKVAYGRIDKDALVKEVKLKDEELEAYYRKHIADYRVPTRVRARHILVRPSSSEEDKEKAWQEARQKIEKILERIKKGEDFAKLAKEYSQDPGSAQRGGDLGWFEEGMMVKEFEKAAMSLEKGEISPIVKTEYGFHIIKVEDKKPGKTISFKEAKKDIEEKLRKKYAIRLARKRMAEFHRLLKETDDTERLKKEAERLGITFRVTGHMDVHTGDAEVLGNDALKDAAFRLPKGGVSGIVDAGKSFYVLKVVDRIDAHLPPFEEIKEQVRKDYIEDAAWRLAKKRAEEVLKDAMAGTDIKELARKEGLKIENTVFFSMRDGIIPDLGLFVARRQALFTLKKELPLYPEVVKHRDGFYIFWLRDSREPSKEAFEKVKDRLRNALIMEKRREKFSQWISELREKADIEINEELL